MRTYSFRDAWHVDAPPSRVWELISRPESYPQWWPIYQEAKVIEDTGGVGSVAHLKFRVLLPYTLSITTRTTRSEPPHLADLWELDWKKGAMLPNSLPNTGISVDSSIAAVREPRFRHHEDVMR